MTELLTGEDVVTYLAGRGVPVPAAEQPILLGGGVSNLVVAVGDVVLKQSRERLEVEAEWLAPRERTLHEGMALRIAARRLDGAVPAVVDIDPDLMTLSIGRAPGSWRPWKTDLLAGQVDVEVARRLGGLLAAWQLTVPTAEERAALTPHEGFRALRLAPYHESAARLQPPDVSEALLEAARELDARADHLVHGDFSPKNVLVGEGALWIIDFEVAHLGDPVFDAAFLLSHLVLKAVIRPDATDALRAAARAFLDAYRAHGGPADDVEPRVTRHVCCLLLARVDGRSPAEYLSETARTRVRGIAQAGLRADELDLDALWAAVMDSCA